jgi:hypothetical protein
MSRRTRTVTPTPPVAEEGGSWHTILVWSAQAQATVYRVQADGVVGADWGYPPEVERQRVPRAYYYLDVAETVVRALNAADRANIPPPPQTPPTKEST